MGDVQDIQHTEQFELRQRKSSPGKADLDAKISGDEYRLSNSERLPSLSHPGDLSLDDFRSLIATCCSICHLRLTLPSTSDECLFYVKNGSLRRNTPSVVLLHETKEGPVLGTLKLGLFRDNTVGIGDPAKEKDIAWENLKRISQWTHATYEFSFGDKGERRTYIWQRTKQPFFSDQPDMELREKLMNGGMGETLAVYKGDQSLSKTKGQFWIAKGLHKGPLGWSDKKGGEWSELELMVLLTGLGIIEGSRRRAKARRGGH